jgi:TonB family protein
MKSPWFVISATRQYALILSVSVHVLIFSIPASLVTKTQIHEMELFVSIEDIRIQPDLVKPRMETKKPQPEPMRKISKPIEGPQHKIEESEISEPCNEVMLKPVKEVIEEPVKEIKEDSQPEIEKAEIAEPIREVRVEPVKEAVVKPTNKIKEDSQFETEKSDMAGPVREVRWRPAEEANDASPKVESKSISQRATEGMEPFVVPLVSDITEGNTGVSTGERLTGMASDVRKQTSGESSIGMTSGISKQPSVGHSVTGDDTSSSIETSFGASVGPAFLHREIPIYPLMARKLGREGRVVLKLTIDEKGNLSDIEVIEKAGYGFTEAAVEAVRKSTFFPAKKNGKPIASRALLPIRFQLERNRW